MADVGEKRFNSKIRLFFEGKSRLKNEQLKSEPISKSDTLIRTCFIKDEKSLELERIYVAKSEQGTGIGSYLLSQAIRIATEKKNICGQMFGRRTKKL